MSNKLLFGSAVVALFLQSAVRAEMTCGIDHVVIDGIKILFGTVVEVVGTGTGYRYYKERSPAVACMRINGRANDDNITVELVPRNWTSARLGWLSRGGYYKVRGALMDAYDGPEKKFNLIVEQLEPIDPAPLTFADFADRAATLEGIAVAGSRLSVGNDQALVGGLAAWPAGAEGKRVSVRGTVRGTAGAWHIENPRWHLLELADQIGQTISLEGMLAQTYGRWWFEYRNEKIYLTGATGRIMTFAWGERGRQVRVTGRLALQNRPSLDHLDYKSLPDLVPTYVIRAAEIEYTPPPQQPDHHLHRRPIRIEDGVPVLVPEGYPSGLMGNETSALFYAGRNHDVIVHIVRHATPEGCDVMARRMADNDVVAPLRLLYAAILACVNDRRGSDFLVRSLEDRRSESFLDTLYCAGMFDWLRREELVENAPPTDLAWAEKPLISVMLDTQRIELRGKVLPKLGPDELPVADAAAYYSQIPSVLMVINSAAAQSALLKYVAPDPMETRLPKRDDDEDSRPTFHEDQADKVVAAICWHDKLPPVDFLLRLEPFTAVGGGGRGKLLVQLLRRKHPAAAERFLQDIPSEYYDFASHLSPEFAAALRPHMGELKGGAKACAMILDALARKDPVPELLKMLDDDEWPLKRLVLYHLAHLADARAVMRVGKVLRNAPRDNFSRFDAEYEAWSIGDPVPDALEAIAKPGIVESMQELIGLLDVDLSRFGGFYKRDDYQRSVAGHLIDLTGESFGVDADKWQAWLNSRDAQEQR